MEDLATSVARADVEREEEKSRLTGWCEPKARTGLTSAMRAPFDIELLPNGLGETGERLVESLMRDLFFLTTNLGIRLTSLQGWRGLFSGLYRMKQHGGVRVCGVEGTAKGFLTKRLLYVGLPVS